MRRLRDLPLWWSALGVLGIVITTFGVVIGADSRQSLVAWIAAVAALLGFVILVGSVNGIIRTRDGGER